MCTNTMGAQRVTYSLPITRDYDYYRQVAAASIK